MPRVKTGSTFACQSSSVQFVAVKRPLSCESNAVTITPRGVVVNFDLGKRFPRPRSQHRGSLRPRARRVAAEGIRGYHPRKIFEIFDARSRVWGQFGPENKLIEGQPNEYDMICRNASVLAFHQWPTIFAVTAFHRVPAPLLP